LASCSPEHASRYFAHVYKHEETFKIADKNAEQLESDLIDSDDDTGNDTLSDDDHTDD
ncbi:unnamed protein product, partial [Rotaria magnacalcarata]